jgi:hypothetical protein
MRSRGYGQKMLSPFEMGDEMLLKDVLTRVKYDN